VVATAGGRERERRFTGKIERGEEGRASTTAQAGFWGPEERRRAARLSPEYLDIGKKEETGLA